MNFIKIEQRNIDRSPPTGWKKTWYGYFQMEKVISQEKLKKDKEAHKISDIVRQEALHNGLGAKIDLLDENFLEQQFFLNILKTFKGHVNLFELGAGRGDWCLALAGVTDFNLIDTEITSYKCLAVEAEPSHFEWTKAHFEEQGIKAIPVYGAIASQNGECKFYSIEDPASNYGQSVRSDGNITVPCYTIDYLIDKYKFDKIDLMHVDIQGLEYEMFLGATKALETGAIKYMIIGTHYPEINDKIINYVKYYNYKAIFSAQCYSGTIDTPFGKAILPVDGILVLKYENS